MLQIVCVVTFLYKSMESCCKMQKVVCHKRNALCYNTVDEVCEEPPGRNVQAVFCCANLRKGVLQDGRNDN